MTAQEIKEFLFTKENVCNCNECPYNEGFDNWQNQLPCGQWHCWVSIHLDRMEQEEEEN